MAIGLNNNKAWFDRAFTAIAEKSGADVELRSVTNSFSVSGGGTSFDSLEIFGGKIPKPGSREDLELSFDAIVASTRDLDWVFHGTSSTATSITTFNDTKKYRVIMLWTDQAGLTSAAQTVNTSSEGYRQIYAECVNTGLDYNFDAGEHLTASLSFSLATVDETGGSNIKKEVTAAAAADSLSAVPSYTASVKF